MTDTTGFLILLLTFVVAAVLIAKAVPQDASELPPKIVKTIAINVDDEIDHHLEAQ